MKKACWIILLVSLPKQQYFLGYCLQHLIFMEFEIHYKRWTHF